MNTTIEIIVAKRAGEPTIKTEDLIMEALDQFHNVVKRFTRFNENSELSNLNRRSGEWTFVSSELYSLVQTMMQFSKDTSGAFDPTVIDFLEVYGYDANYDFSKLDNVDLDNIVKDIAKKRPGWQEIEMKKQGSDNLIKLAKGQRIDLGGLGKGYAIDLAYSALSSLSNFMINAGGDIRTKGVNEKGSAWSARLLHKDKNDELRTFSTMKLYDEALACSGSWARKVRQFHHLIDTKTGKPYNENKTVYVKASSAMFADAIATSLFIGGKELLNTLPYSVDAIIIDSNDKIHISGDWKPQTADI